jgi:two-component system response regulator DevR
MADDAPRTRVLLVDDHEVVRLGIRDLLGHVATLEVVGEAASAAEARRRTAELKPDVVLLDLRLPDGSGVEVCRDIRAESPQTAVLMLTSYSDDEALYQSILAGAAGYLLKQVRAGELVDAIRRVARGESLLDPAVTRSVFERLRRPAIDPLGELTDQERRILELIAQGKTNRDIAEVVFLSDKTVKHYVSSILAKLNIQRRSEAAAIWARQAGGPEAPA